ncbi:tripartite tricarboxylate transporter permease [Alteribacillus iranensis]|uniref:Putative tricarboxylic transport membrane protein n=1 Tax=Alteribacillus iranensis TaxID=930128 RepID=A0A1I2BIJ5_9BACI|nr:tripartite tricarboxylate transporter permease [Alteribacillus iranensis]SFE55757.1 putative tricarboxylic transport membrane protein [Alteribacillus iranensis]
MPDITLILDSLWSMLTIKHLLLFVIGTIAGILIGSLPGLTTTMGISLLISFTWGMDWLEAVTLIIALHVGGTYGGSTAAIFLNIPGTPAAAATALDGYPMAQKGEGGLARGIATVQSFLGTVIAAVIFLVAAPLLVELSMNFGSWEYFMLAFFGILISANITSGSLIKGLMAGVLGLMLATVGMDSITGNQRFTFGEASLMDGFSLIAVLIGLFGITEIIHSLMELKPPLKSKNVKSTIPPWRLVKKFLPLGGRSSVVGAFVGSVPGVGADVASWVSYDWARRKSKDKESFGKGNPEGVVASETANNACIPGSYVPMLTLGIPGDSVTAVIMGGLLLHGLQPGPKLTVSNPTIVYEVFFILVISAAMMLIFGLLFTSVFQKVLLLPKSTVLTVIVVISIIGTFAVNNRPFDILVMFAFGIIGYFMRMFGMAAPPLVLGLILGLMAEQNFRRAMLSADYSFLPFVTRPLSLLLLILIVLVFLFQSEKVKNWFAAKRKRLFGNS